MPPLLRTILHHAEAVDPDLVDRIRHEIDSITGFEPSTIVLLIGVLIVLFPVILLGLYVVGPRAHGVRAASGGNTAGGTLVEDNAAAADLTARDPADTAAP